MGGVWRGSNGKLQKWKQMRGKEARKWFRKIMYGGAKSANCRGMDPKKIVKEGCGKWSEWEVM